MTDYQELISRFLYDELDEAQQAELNAWIAADPAHADLFMRETFVNRHFMERRLVDAAVISLAEHLPAEPSETDIVTAEAEAAELMPVSAPAPIFKIGIRLAGVAAAAVLLIATTLPMLTNEPDSPLNGRSIDELLETEWARVTDRSDLYPATYTNAVGDITQDDVVDIFDFYALETNVGRAADNQTECGDLNGDGRVELQDFAKLQRAFGAKGVR